MSMHMLCDGCGAELDPHVPYDPSHKERVIHGERANEMVGGAGLPDGDFDWCRDCARAAFAAVKAR